MIAAEKHSRQPTRTRRCCGLTRVRLAAQVELSRLSLTSGDGATALRYAQEARQTDPSSLDARVALARSLIAAGNLARAEAEINELLKGAPNAAVVHAVNGALLASRSNPAAARTAFERALELSPGFLEALGGLTYLDLVAKTPARAIARLEPEIAKQPASAPLLALLARAQSAAGDQAKAEQALRRAVSVDPRFTPGYTMLGQLYIQQRRIDEARAEFEGMVQRDPSAVGARTMVGMLLEAQGKRDDARKSYEATVNGTENAPVAANNLAFIYAEQGTNLDVALQLATSAKQRLPDDPSVDDTIGWVYYKKDLPSLAVRPLEDSLKKRLATADTAEVLYHLGLTYAKLGDKAKARETLGRALKLDPKVGGDEAQRVRLRPGASFVSSGLGVPFFGSGRLPLVFFWFPSPVGLAFGFTSRVGAFSALFLGLTVWVWNFLIARFKTNGLIAVPSVQASSLRLTSGSTVFLIPDGGGNDTNLAPNVITFSGAVGLYTINVTTGSLLGSTATAPLLSLTSVDTSSATGSGATLAKRTLLIEFTQTGFGPSGPGALLLWAVLLGDQGHSR